MSSEVDFKSISDILKHSSSEDIARSVHYHQLTQTLELHECWSLWFAAVKSHTKLNRLNLDDYVKMIRVNIIYLEDIDAASILSRDLLQIFRLGYLDFRNQVLDQVLEFEDFRNESVILTGVWEYFSLREDQISAIERVCFIFEKKAHNESLLHQYYEKLRKIHPENPKALRYFRNLYSQSQEWALVIEVLSKLLTTAKHKQEVFRYAQEAAAVYLYQLGNYEESIRYIEEYCAGSTLDTSTIHYEAYFRLGNLDGCLRVLRSALNAADDQLTKSIIHYRIAVIYEQLNQYEQSYENFKKTLELNDNFFEAIEGLICSAIKLKKWVAVLDWLNVLAGRTQFPHLAVQIKTGIERLKEGLSNANL
jgi:tetratricopeptide (TPR) repeat protein